MRLLSLMLPIVVCVSSTALSQDSDQPDHKSNKLPFRIAKETTYITGPLTKDGLVDYEAYLNQELSKGVTPENNAAVLYLQAIGDGPALTSDRNYYERLKQHLGTDPFSEGGPYLVDFGDVYQEMSGKQESEYDYKQWPENRRDLHRPWKSEEHPVVKKWLDLNRLPLERVIAGTQMSKHFGALGHYEETHAVGFLSPSDSVMHSQFALMLEVRSMLSLGENRADEAIRDVLAIHRLARHTSPDSSFWALKERASCSSRAFPVDVGLANSANVSADLLRNYLKQRRQLRPLLDINSGLWVDRLTNLDTFQRVCTSEPKADPREQNDWELLGLSVRDRSSAMFASAFLNGVDCNQIMMEINQFYDRVDEGLRFESFVDRQEKLDEILADYKQRYELRNNEANSVISLLASPKQRGERMTSILLGSRAFRIEIMHEWATVAIACERLSLLGLAVALHQKTTNQLPDKLEELKPDYLTEIPLDPFTGQPFAYRVDDERAVLYSVGPNLVDDEGRLPRIVIDYLFSPTLNNNEYDIVFPVNLTAPK